MEQRLRWLRTRYLRRFRQVIEPSHILKQASCSANPYISKLYVDVYEDDVEKDDAWLSNPLEVCSAVSIVDAFRRFYDSSIFSLKGQSGVSFVSNLLVHCIKVDNLPQTPIEISFKDESLKDWLNGLTIPFMYSTLNYTKNKNIMSALKRNNNANKTIIESKNS